MSQMLLKAVQTRALPAKMRFAARLAACVAAACVALLLTACATSNAAIDAVPADPFAGRKAADLSGYASMADSEEPIFLVDTSVQELVELADKGETFAFVAAFAQCRHCNKIMPQLNRVAAETGRFVGYLNTRKDPSWTSNTQIDDYDLFVERFGEHLELDEHGTPHLYTPDLYLVKDGNVVANHQGVVAGADDPQEPLTQEQERELQETLRSMFDLLS